MDRKAGLISQVTDSFPHAGFTSGFLKDKVGNIWVNRLNGGVSFIDSAYETVRSLTKKKCCLEI